MLKTTRRHHAKQHIAHHPLLHGRDFSRLSGVNNTHPPTLASLALIKESWAKIGVELIVEPLNRSANMARSGANDYDISVDVISGGLDPTQSPRAYLTVHPGDSRQALPGVRGYDTQGAQGLTPSLTMQKRVAAMGSVESGEERYGSGQAVQGNTRHRGG